ncbi:MAG: translation initiation factor 2 [Thermus sp.]|uniref:translation initiation factor 2 n=1 Tax=Thermus sp. TaxID=275 RepID=UPI0025F3A1EB|nr:translation initiation factor 2 [Thermus sp.]MCS6868658.1 translation initiation factor 2 [Thermus sp.]MCS7217969.1 translation initiation factor 2 [Thermus sp.]MDW8357042.1 translation initiation factor 2 [Thermus sp.]
MKRILVLTAALLGFSLAQSLVVEVRGSLEAVEARTLRALREAGLEPDRVLNLGEQVRQVTGPGFPDYRLVVLKPEAGSVEAASKNPMAAIVLPPTVFITGEGGRYTVGTLDGRLLFGMLGVYGGAVERLVWRLEAALGRLGPVRQVAPAMMPDPRSGMMPALLYRVPGAKLEDVVLMVETELTSAGLNLLPNVRVGPVTVIMPCKSEWARVMFLTQPAGGFAAPCRFFAMPMGEDVLVGAIEPMLMTIMPGVMGSPAVTMLQEARQVMLGILEAVGGVPHRLGP